MDTRPIKRDKDTKFELDLQDNTRWFFLSPSQQTKATILYVEEIADFWANEHYFTHRLTLDYFLIKYTIAGEGYLEYEGNSYSAKENQLFFIDCHKPQYYRTSQSRKHWRVLWILFQGSTAAGYYEIFKTLNNNSPLVCLPTNNTVLPYMTTLLHLCATKETALSSEVYMSGYLTQILVEICRNIEEQREWMGVPDFVEKARQYLTEHYAQKITLDDLASEYAVSKFHLQRQFKAYIGYTPNEYLTKIRLNQAKALLRTTNRSVTQIAYDVGVENVGHFINQFKKQEDITPTKFRKKWSPA